MGELASGNKSVERLPEMPICFVRDISLAAVYIFDSKRIKSGIVSYASVRRICEEIRDLLFSREKVVTCKGPRRYKEKTRRRQKIS